MSDRFSEPNETGLLCCMMRSWEALDACKGLPEEAFFIPAHKILFRAMLSFHAKRQPVDFILLQHHLEQQTHGKVNELVEVGGIHELSRIYSYVPTAENWKWYRGYVLQYHRRRQLNDREKTVMLGEIKQLNDHVRWLESLLPDDALRVESWMRRGSNRQQPKDVRGIKGMTT